MSLCDPMDCSPPGSSVHGILQAKILEQVAIPFSKRSSWLRDQIEPVSLMSNLPWQAGSLPSATCEAPITSTSISQLLLGYTALTENPSIPIVLTNKSLFLNHIMCWLHKGRLRLYSITVAFFTSFIPESMLIEQILPWAFCLLAERKGQ